MRNVRYQALGPLLSGEGSRAFLGLEISEDNRAKPVVLVWAPEIANSDPEFTARLAKETARAAALQHPNIIRVYGLAQVDEGYARVVEFADGESLRKILEVTGTMPPELAAFVAAEVASGVHFAHLTGIEDGTPLVHGDIRPETVMVSFSGLCKVSGYGALSLAPKELNGKRVVGRRSHCAPEQIIGGRDAAIRETDVYLLGLLLYECITGMIPFGNEKDFDAAVVSQPLQMLNFDAIPLKLVEVISKATQKRAADRFPTALAFREAVESAVGVLATPDVLAAYLKQYFPEGHEARAARRRELDNGIADFARRQWEQSPPDTGAFTQAAEADPKPLSGPLGQTFPTDLATTIPISTHSVQRLMGTVDPQPVPRPSPPVVRAPQKKSESPGPNRPRSSRGWLGPGLALLCLGVGAGGVYWGLEQSRKPQSPLPPRPQVVAQMSAPPVEPHKPAVVPVPPPAASAPERPSANSVTSAIATPATPLKTMPAVARTPRSASARSSTEPTSLELTVNPPVNVSIDGKSLGRSPVTVAVSPGRHQLAMTDAQQGIHLSKGIMVPASGKSMESVEIGKGTVSISAPDGSVVALDGKVIGKAPLGDFPVWEGSHRIVVTMGKAKWQQPFNVRDSETMTFNVESTAAP